MRTQSGNQTCQADIYAVCAPLPVALRQTRKELGLKIIAGDF